MHAKRSGWTLSVVDVWNRCQQRCNWRPCPDTLLDPRTRARRRSPIIRLMLFTPSATPHGECLGSVATSTTQSLAKTARSIPELHQTRPSVTSRQRLPRSVNFESKPEFRTCLSQTSAKPSFISAPLAHTDAPRRAPLGSTHRTHRGYSVSVSCTTTPAVVATFP